MTLIELLIVVAIGAVIMIALLELYMAGQKYFFNQNARADTIEDSRYPMTWISRDVREAYKVREAAVTVNGATYTTSGNCLVLEVPALGVDGLIIWDPDTPDDNLDYIVYILNSGRLKRVIQAVGPGRNTGSRVMADNVSSFQVRYFQSDGLTTPTDVAPNYASTNVVEISLASSTKGIFRSGQSFNEGLTTQIKLRNRAIT
jgi:type II secretory pathway component PulJ